MCGTSEDQPTHCVEKTVLLRMMRGGQSYGPLRFDNVLDNVLGQALADGSLVVRESRLDTHHSKGYD